MEIKDINNIEEIKKILKNIFNEEVEYISSGWGSNAFSCGKKIIRTPKSLNHLKCYEKERDIMDFLSKKSSFEISKTKIFLEPIFYVLTEKKSSGVKWSKETILKLSQKEKNAFFESIVSFFIEIHNTDLKELSSKINIKDLYANTKSWSYEELENTLKLEFSSKEIEKYYNRYLKLIDSKDKKVLLHKDFYEDNSRVDDKHILKSVFDFGNTEINDIEYEFLSLNNEFYENIFLDVFKIYEKNTGYKINFEKMKEIKLIDKFGCLKYLNESNLREKMKHEWECCIRDIKKIK